MFPVPLTMPVPNNILPPVILPVALTCPPVNKLPAWILPVSDSLPLIIKLAP